MEENMTDCVLYYWLSLSTAFDDGSKAWKNVIVVLYCQPRTGWYHYCCAEHITALLLLVTKMWNMPKTYMYTLCFNIYDISGLGVSYFMHAEQTANQKWIPVKYYSEIEIYFCQIEINYEYPGKGAESNLQTGSGIKSEIECRWIAVDAHNGGLQLIRRIIIQYGS